MAEAEAEPGKWARTRRGRSRTGKRETRKARRRRGGRRSGSAKCGGSSRRQCGTGRRRWKRCCGRVCHMAACEWSTTFATGLVHATPLTSTCRQIWRWTATQAETSSSVSKGSRKGRPVLFFVHGGVWASGEKWMYSPLAIRFAQSGAVVVTIQYTLYPEALAIDQVQETSKALSWAMDHIQEYGGDPSRIFFSGHSSGAHVCSMVVWRRLRSRLRQMFHANATAVAPADAAPTSGAACVAATAEPDSSSSSSSSRDSDSAKASPKGEDLWALDEEDLRQPYCFFGMSGVYDIAHHQRHEQRRGVYALSAMSPAVGGPSRFLCSSPALLFDALASAAADAASAAAEAADVAAGAAAAGAAATNAAAASFRASFDCPFEPCLDPCCSFSFSP
ncbi:hypothetical protein CLOM_g20167 [Closterium sp. NIES-68]|nr:hypothetical protein CLOM_g20167 [Closterium sp. NIES-68]